MKAWRAWRERGGMFPRCPEKGSNSPAGAWRRELSPRGRRADFCDFCALPVFGCYQSVAERGGFSMGESHG